LASYTGHLIVNEEEIDINNWIGSQNHNWGSQHTDRYAWAQVAGFDNKSDSFLEIATAQIKLGMIYHSIYQAIKIMALLNSSKKDPTLFHHFLNLIPLLIALC